MNTRHALARRLAIVSVAMGVIAAAPPCSALSVSPLYFENIDLNNATLAEAVAQIRVRVDGFKVHHQPFNLLALPGAGEGKRVTGQWTRIKSDDLFAELARQADLGVRIDKYAVVFYAKTASASSVRPPAPTLEADKSAFRRVVISQLEFRDATIAEVVAHLNSRSPFHLPTARDGFRIRNDCAKSEELKPVTLALANVPVGEVVRYVSEITGLTVKASGNEAGFACPAEGRKAK